MGEPGIPPTTPASQFQWLKDGAATGRTDPAPLALGSLLPPGAGLGPVPLPGGPRREAWQDIVDRTADTPFLPSMIRMPGEPNTVDVDPVTGHLTAMHNGFRVGEGAVVRSDLQTGRTPSGEGRIESGTVSLQAGRFGMRISQSGTGAQQQLTTDLGSITATTPTDGDTAVRVETPLTAFTVRPDTDANSAMADIGTSLASRMASHAVDTIAVPKADRVTQYLNERPVMKYALGVGGVAGLCAYSAAMGADEYRDLPTLKLREVKLGAVGVTGTMGVRIGGGTVYPDVTGLGAQVAMPDSLRGEVTLGGQVKTADGSADLTAGYRTAVGRARVAVTTGVSVGDGGSTGRLGATLDYAGITTSLDVQPDGSTHLGVSVPLP